ncbi:hypothetical protein FQN50_005064 [Emmonsiellopsis sp. PD_5]|nr:hypothetical protein FQN50_005064 [Emmonsiellopsis sp. PD_5]
MALYNAFGWEPPAFGHVPLLIEKSGQKLSKRNADIDISFFRDKQEVFPEALANFSALLGWSHQQKSDIFSLKALEQTFDLKLTKGNTIVAFEKLWFLQSAHAQRYAAEGGPEFQALVNRIEKAVREKYTEDQLPPLPTNQTLHDRIAAILREGGARTYTNTTKFLEDNKPFFTRSLDRPPYTPVSPSKPKSKTSVEDPPTTTAPEPTTPITTLHTACAALSLVPPTHWTTETHKENISFILASDPPPTTTTTSSPQSPSQSQPQKRLRADLYHYLRWALSGGKPGINIPATMAILGRDECVRRLEEARELTRDEEGDGVVKARSRRMPRRGGDGDVGVGAGGAGGEGREWMGSLAGVRSDV